MIIMKMRNTSTIVGIFAALMGIAIVLLVPLQIPGESWDALTNVQSPAFFPLLNAVFLAICGLALIFKPAGSETDLGHDGEPERVSFPLTLVLTVALLVIYLAMIRYVGMVVSSAVTIAVMSVLLGYRNKPVIVISALIFPVVLYALFEKVLKILLPHGGIF